MSFEKCLAEVSFRLHDVAPKLGRYFSILKTSLSKSGRS
jgi:hypothetical protein